MQSAVPQAGNNAYDSSQVPDPIRVVIVHDPAGCQRSDDGRNSTAQSEDSHISTVHVFGREMSEHGLGDWGIDHFGHC